MKMEIVSIIWIWIADWVKSARREKEREIERERERERKKERRKRGGEEILGRGDTDARACRVCAVSHAPQTVLA